MTMADEVVIMRDGRIEQSGSPMDIYDNPNNLFVAQFIGSPGMNILDCVVAEDEAGLYASHDEFTLPLPAGANVAVGQKIKYGIRPEHLRTAKTSIHSVSRDGGSKDLSGLVRVVEPTGPEIHVYSKLAGNDICSITRERISWEPGETIFFQPDLEHVHVFDGESQKVL